MTFSVNTVPLICANQKCTTVATIKRHNCTIICISLAEFIYFGRTGCLYEYETGSLNSLAEPARITQRGLERINIIFARRSYTLQALSHLLGRRRVLLWKQIHCHKMLKEFRVIRVRIMVITDIRVIRELLNSIQVTLLKLVEAYAY